MRPRRLIGEPHLSATTAHVLPLPLSLPLPGGTDLLASIRPRMRPLSLAARWDLPVSADRPFARSPSLVCGPRLSATAPFPNVPLALSVVDAPMTARFPTTSPAPEPFSGVRAHSLPSPSYAPSQTPSLSCSRSAHAPMELRRDPPPFCGYC